MTVKSCSLIAFRFLGLNLYRLNKNITNLIILLKLISRIPHTLCYSNFLFNLCEYIKKIIFPNHMFSTLK